MSRRITRAIVGLLLIVAVASAGWYGVHRWRTRASASRGTAPIGPVPSAPSQTTPTETPRGEVVLDTRRQQLTGVRTARVQRAALQETVRAAGTVRYDETRLTDINVKLEGWIRKLLVDYTGQAIRKDQPLFSFYSPDIRNTAREYVLALKAREDLHESTIADAQRRAADLAAAARTRLALWDIPEDTIRGLEQTREVPDTVIFRSSVAGFVVDKMAVEGLHVMPGQSLYRVADLSVVWVEAELHENELGAAQAGHTAIVTLQAYPSMHVRGRVVFVNSFVNEATRTNKVRIELPNADGRLKPGMYATVELQTSRGTGLTVPADAVLDSGVEQLVFLSKGNGRFEARHVKTGRRSGDAIEILDGVTEGDEVATSATFFLDSESQLRAAVRGFDATAPATSATAGPQLAITLRTTPTPARTGENQFEVVVKDSAGAAIADAEVAVQLFMPAMPTMNMPAMRDEVKLTPAGGGVYRGTGQVMIAGRWDATVTVSRGGQRLGSSQLSVVAR